MMEDFDFRVPIKVDGEVSTTSWTKLKDIEL